MNEYKLLVEAEYEAIEKSLATIPEHADFSKFNSLEIAGIAAIIHSFYNGTENVLKQILKHNNTPLPTGASWHKELLSSATQEGFISKALEFELLQFMAFRHFFTHAYALDLIPERITFLINKAPQVFEQLKREIEGFL